MTISRRLFLSLIPSLAFLGGKKDQPQPKKIKTMVNRFSVAGFQYYEGESVIRSLNSGDGLTLKAEPSNPYDCYAVEIFHGRTKLGYVPRSDNKHISRLLRNGADVFCEVNSTAPGSTSWEALSVAVFLISESA